MNQSTKDVFIRPLFLFGITTCSSGILCLLWLLATPSSEKNAVLLGLSAWRLLAGIFLLVGITLTGGISLAVFRGRPSIFLKKPSFIEGDFGLVIFLLCIVEIMLVSISAFQSPVFLNPLSDVILKKSESWFQIFLIIQPVIARLFPIIVWLLIIVGSAICALLAGYQEKSRDLWRSGGIERGGLVGFILICVAFQWATILLQLKVFLEIPGWKWWFTEKPFQSEQYLILVLIAGVLALGWYLLSIIRIKWQHAALLVMAGYMIQLGFGYFDGGGWESLRLKYANSVFNRYAEVAAGNTSLIDSLRNYESWYGGEDYLETKPPGILIPYYLAATISELLFSAEGKDDRFTRLTLTAAILFPVAGYSVVLVLIKLRKIIPGFASASLIPGLLYITCPNVILVPVFLDQALFPLLFLLSIWMFWQVIRRASWGWAFATGFAVYGFIYISFSLLPAVLLGGSWLALNWFFRKDVDRKQCLVQGVSLAVGFLLGMGLIYLLLNYDPFTRYNVAMMHHRETRSLTTGLDQIDAMVWLNNAELVMYTGFPVIMLFVVHGLRTFFKVRTTPWNQSQFLLISFLVMLVFLNVFSQTIGEVQRLWLFLVPILSLYAAVELDRFPRYRKAIVLLILMLQLTTAFLLYRYQDFYG